MYYVTIDLAAGLVILAPDKPDITPKASTFERVDLNMPGCIIFYGASDEFIMAVPWTSINIILFEKL